MVLYITPFFVLIRMDPFQKETEKEFDNIIEVIREVHFLYLFYLSYSNK